MEKAREQTRWFPAMVGNHVADIVERYGMDSPDIPASLTAYIEGRKGYDYKEHADKDADHLEFISEDIVDAFGILGSVDDHIAKLKGAGSGRRDAVQYLFDVRRGRAHRGRIR